MYLNFLSKIFSQSAEKFRRGSLVCFRESLVSKSLYMRGGKGVSRFSVPIYKLKNVSKSWDSNPTYQFKTLLSYQLSHGNHCNF